MGWRGWSLVLALSVVGACGSKGAASDGGTQATGGGGVVGAGGGGGAAASSATGGTFVDASAPIGGGPPCPDLFDQNVVRTYSLDIAPSDWAARTLGLRSS